MCQFNTFPNFGSPADPLSQRIRELIATPEDAHKIATLAIDYLANINAAAVSAHLDPGPTDSDPGSFCSLAQWAKSSRHLEIVQSLLATVVLPEQVEG